MTPAPILPSSEQCFLVFVKAPVPGQVKTRLGQRIGMQPAADLYRCFGQDLLITLDQLRADVIIFYAPAHAERSIREWLGASRHYRPQSDGDLGRRMSAAFQYGFEAGYERCLIVGSDSPDLPVNYLETTFTALKQGQVVLGASSDGGYYTLGFTPQTFCPGVFIDMPWSTPQVYGKTLNSLHRASRAVHLLPEWFDIDTLDDLWAFYQRHPHPVPSSYSLNYLCLHAKRFFQGYDA